MAKCLVREMYHPSPMIPVYGTILPKAGADFRTTLTESCNITEGVLSTMDSAVGGSPDDDR